MCEILWWGMNSTSQLVQVVLLEVMKGDRKIPCLAFLCYLGVYFLRSVFQSTFSIDILGNGLKKYLKLYKKSNISLLG